MIKKKYILNIYNIIIWGLIILLTSYVLMKACTIYNEEKGHNTAIEFTKDVIVDISKGVLNVFTPITQYVNKYEDETKKSVSEHNLSKLINSLFPVLEYVKNVYDYNFYTAKESYLSEGFETEDEYVSINVSSNNLRENDLFNPENFVDIEEIIVEESETDNIEAIETINRVGTTYSLKALQDYKFLVSTFYVVDRSTTINDKILDAQDLLGKDMTIDINSKKPQILIYHTHSQEQFEDSTNGDTEDTIVGVGSYLTKLLQEKGIKVMHNKSTFDIIDGKLDRNKAYTQAGKKVSKILEEYPSIEVVIDLHRDGIGDTKNKLLTTINGKKTAQIMFFNGLSRNTNGAIEYLYNPYIQDNLAFSFQLQLKAAESFPGFTRRIYLKNYRYNLHLKPKSLLIEVGAQNNTVQEAKNAMEPLAEILYDVLTGE